MEQEEKTRLINSWRYLAGEYHRLLNNTNPIARLNAAHFLEVHEAEDERIQHSLDSIEQEGIMTFLERRYQIHKNIINKIYKLAPNKHQQTDLDLRDPENLTEDNFEKLESQRKNLQTREESAKGNALGDAISARYNFLNRYYLLVQEYNKQNFDFKQDLEDEIHEELSDLELKFMPDAYQDDLS